MPDLEARGFKIAHDKHGPLFDPDQGDRLPSAAALADVRAYLSALFAPLRSSLDMSLSKDIGDHVRHE
jgi:hypothetical protein